MERTKTLPGQSMRERNSRERRAVFRAAAIFSAWLLISTSVAAQCRPETSRTWIRTTDLNVGRFHHTANLLADGRVLVAGGHGGSGVNATSQVEIYSPSTQAWTVVEPLRWRRRGHTATSLFDGRLLVAGGYTLHGRAPMEEIYDPVSGSWRDAGAMLTGRSGHTATRLPDGKVLVAGGWAEEPLDKVELFDPGAESWAPIASLNDARSHHTATLLADGRLLVVGGLTEVSSSAGVSPPLAHLVGTVEVYDPALGVWTFAAPLAEPRSHHRATRLRDGRVLVSGGGLIGAGSEIYDPETDLWSPGDPMTHGRRMHSATLLADGGVLVVGGQDPYPIGTSELFDPVSLQWSDAGEIPGSGRILHSATLLQDGAVLVAGSHRFGSGGGSGAAWTAWLYCGPAPNQPPVALCRDASVEAGSDCTGDASIDAGSYDPDGDPISLSQDPAPPYGLGETLVTLTAEDDSGASDSCQATVTVEDVSAPIVSCNSPPSISPPEVPISFTATAVDNCAVDSVQVTDYACFKPYKPRRGTHPGKTPCKVSSDGPTVTIHRSGGVGSSIVWDVMATDQSANPASTTCRLAVTPKGRTR